ncbi:sporulation kinase [Desulfocucumis palustris]|uniref:histidine kinase n=1 Tax=Desulfocucumis palustris TaxID=1898651 RepID=A0A2L2X771_9FIRM|nr:PAS domain S-box protein [Desulfocucumis palustris]GBF32029.1 sporulation kinase [Desulfocucumis palustris]
MHSIEKDREKLLREMASMRRSIDELEQSRETLRRRNDMLKVLSQSSANHLEFPFAKINYQPIAKQLLKLTGALCVAVNTYHEAERMATTRALAGKKQFLQKVVELAGFSPVGRIWPIDDEYLVLYKTGRLVEINGPYELLFKNIPGLNCLNFENIYETGKIYGIGLVRKEHILGNLTIIMPAGKKLEEIDMVEIFANILAAACLRNNAEKELGESRQRYLSLIENFRDAIFVARSDGRFINANPAASRLLGYNKNELLKMNIPDIPPSELVEVIMAKFNELVEKGVLENFETILQHKNGSHVPVEISATVLPEGLYLGTARDIRQRKGIEECLRLSEERFSIAFNASPSLMMILNFKTGRIIDVNDSFLLKLKYQRHEVLDRKTTELKFWVKSEEPGSIRRKIIEKGTVYNREINIYDSSGEIHVGLYSADKIYIDGKEHLLASINDITQYKNLEKDMARLEKLHLVGEMAAGIGHEIRNPMTTIRGLLQMLGKKEECVKYKEFYDLMISELDRANSIITEFLSVAKNKHTEFKTQNLNEILRKILPLIQADAINAKMQLSVATENVPDTPLNEEEIRQLILNLVRNGLEAMPAGGILEIRTYSENGEVFLSVRDQGKGIEKEIIDKIGTPFFTTKDYGTGLGLATCYGIAARHNAVISLETGPGGTAFSVRFKVNRPSLR